MFRAKMSISSIIEWKGSFGGCWSRNEGNLVAEPRGLGAWQMREVIIET